MPSKLLFMSDLITCSLTKRFQLTMVFTEMCKIKAGYFLGFFGGQILKALMFSVDFRQFYIENTLNNLD
jgi:hypothetical protein